MRQTAPLIAAALLLTLCIAAASCFVCTNRSYTVGYDDLHITEHQFKGNLFTIKASSDLDGEYLYKVLVTQHGEPGELVLTFRGGKQPSRAQTPGKTDATFVIEVPAGTKRIVCDGTTVYTID